MISLCDARVCLAREMGIKSCESPAGLDGLDLAHLLRRPGHGGDHLAVTLLLPLLGQRSAEPSHWSILTMLTSDWSIMLLLPSDWLSVSCSASPDLVIAARAAQHSGNLGALCHPVVAVKCSDIC